MSVKPDYENTVNDNGRMKFLIKGFDKLLFEHDFPVIGTTELFGVTVRLCSKEESDAVKWADDRIRYYMAKYNMSKYENSRIMDTSISVHMLDDLRDKFRGILNSLNNALTYKLDSNLITVIIYNAS